MRRLVSALKRQDWVLVLLELAVVVIGIFLGLQANDWNEQRLDAKRADATIVKLVDEFEGIVEESTWRTELHENNVRLLRELIFCLENDCSEDKLSQLVPEAFRAGDRFITLPPRSNAYLELVSSGQIDLIGSPELRRALFAFDVENVNATTASNSVTDHIIAHIAAFQQHGRLDISRSDGPSVMEVVLRDGTVDAAMPKVASWDWDAMRTDPDFRVAADNLLRMQIYYTANHGFVREEAKAVLALLEKQ